MSDQDHFPVPPTFNHTLVLVTAGAGNNPDQVTFWDFTNEEAATEALQFINATTRTPPTAMIIKQHRSK